MSVSEEIGMFVATLISTLKTESVNWQQENQEKLLKLQEERAISEQQTKQQLEEMEIRFNSQRQRIQMEEEHSTQEFRDFLDSIDKTKAKMLEYYPQMPTPIALMIHHRAAELLREAWRNPDAREALKQHNKFMDLMLTVTEDFSELAEGSTRKMLPEKTIEFLKDAN